MDTINQFLDVLEQIKNTCEEHYHGCDGCPFLKLDKKWDVCRIKEITYMCYGRPCDFKMDEMRKKAND